tara:strand:+ start:277 stop:618 length:342 start_codon:yes stop_codon:yes gene_type:complete
MSLDVELMVTKPTSVYSRNITHNLAKMAGEVKLSNGLTLYDVLWRPDEHGITHARTIVDYLHKGWDILLSNPKHYKQWDPENGWGSYESLVDYVYTYRNACWDNMDAEVRVSR